MSDGRASRMVLAARSWGDPLAPVALLVHGAGDSMATWSQVGPWLADRGWNAIAVDLRGHGDSASPPSGSRVERSLSAFAGDVLETLRVLRSGPAHADVVIGYALGALVSLTCVAEHPWFARRLVLEGPLDAGRRGEEARAGIVAARCDPLTFARAYFADVADPPDEVRREIVAGIAAADAAFVAAVLEELEGEDLRGLAERSSHPALVLSAARDGHALHRVAFGAYAGAVASWLTSSCPPRRLTRSGGADRMHFSKP